MTLPRLLGRILLVLAMVALGSAQGDAKGVLLVGNSITEQWPLKDPEFFENHPDITAAGISGQTSRQIAARLTDELDKVTPDTVVLSAGINDIALNDSIYSEDATFANITGMASEALRRGIVPVIASLLPAEGFKWRPEVKDSMEKIRSLNSRLQEYCAANGLLYIDYFTPMLNSEATALNPLYSDEPIAVHPNRRGYRLMATLLLATLTR